MSLTDAHNTFLSVAAQSGVFALIALVIICWTAIRRTLRPSGQRSLIHATLGAAFISAFIWQGLIGSFEETRHLWVLIGMILGLSASMPKPQPTEEPLA